MKMNYDEGFTFIETILVITIGAILIGGASIPAVKYVDKARVLSAESKIEVFRHALYEYYYDCGVYPTTEQGLIALFEKPQLYPIPALWNGPYVTKKDSTDPWGTKFIYQCPGLYGLDWILISFGSDKKEGGTGNAQDIVSW